MTLDAVKHAAQARSTAEQNYRAAVLAAVAEHGATKTAQAAGVTRQAVRQLVARIRDDEAKQAARLAELDASYDRAVQTLAGADHLRDGAGITAYRNGQAAKRRRKGIAPLPTLKAEALSRAESRLLEMLQAGLEAEGFTPADLDEATRLREAVSDDDVPF